MVGKSFVGLAILALAGFAQAQPHRHHKRDAQNHNMVHQMYKKDVVWVTVTRTTTVNYVPTATMTATKSHQQGVAEVREQPSNPPVVDASTTKKDVTVTGGDGGGPQGVSGVRGVVYSAKEDSGSCIQDDNVVKKALATLGEYNLIRVYGPECQQVKRVLDLTDKKVFAGIYDCDNEGQVLEALEDIVKQVDGRWERVHTISVGNEVVNKVDEKDTAARAAKASHIRNMVSIVRNAARKAGYQGPVVTTDTLAATKTSHDLCDSGDYIAVNCHPFFDNHVGAGGSATFIQEQIGFLSGFCNNGKPILVTETGWPKRGDGTKQGEFAPSKANQDAAVSSIKKLDGYILLSAYDEKWKGAGTSGQFSAEDSWGVLDN